MTFTLDKMRHKWTTSPFIFSNFALFCVTISLPQPFEVGAGIVQEGYSLE